MYAIIQTGGKQYKVEKGTTLRVELLDAEPNAVVSLDPILLVKEDGTVSNEKITVKAKVIEHGKGEKLDIFKYKPKKNYRRRMGHRQPFTKIEITEVA